MLAFTPFARVAIQLPLQVAVGGFLPEYVLYVNTGIVSVQCFYN